MDDAGNWERNLFLLAVVIISLIRWIVNTIQERRQSSYDHSPDTETRSDQAPQDLPEDFEPTWSQRSAPTSAPEPSSPSGNLAEELGKFFDTLKDTPTTTEESASSSPPLPEPEETIPPPLPTTALPTSALTKSEQKALDTFTSHPPSESQPQMRTARRRSLYSPQMLAHALRDPVSLRRAFVLKELLDGPIALRADRDFNP